MIRTTAISLASCLVIASTTAALPAGAQSGRAPASVSRGATRPPNACGEYQCFYDAEDFLRSVPQPLPEHVATAPLRARAVGAAPGTPGMLVGLDNGSWSFWNVSDGFAQGRSGVIGGVSAGNVFNFRHWQYVDALYYYLHETVSVPPTQWVNAAHRNGVPVLGTVTSDCPVCGPEAAALSDGTSDVIAATTNRPGWTRTVGALEAEGKTITAISVGARGNGRDRVAALLGQLRVYDANSDAVPAPITVDSPGPVITWSAGAEQDFARWNVYLATPSCLRFLGPAVTNHYRVTQPMFGAGRRSARYVIQPVSATGSAPEVGSTCRARR